MGWTHGLNAHMQRPPHKGTLWLPDTALGSEASEKHSTTAGLLATTPHEVNPGTQLSLWEMWWIWCSLAAGLRGAKTQELYPRKIKTETVNKYFTDKHGLRTVSSDRVLQPNCSFLLRILVISTGNTEDFSFMSSFSDLPFLLWLLDPFRLPAPGVLLFPSFTCISLCFFSSPLQWEKVGSQGNITLLRISGGLVFGSFRKSGPRHSSIQTLILKVRKISRA